MGAQQAPAEAVDRRDPGAVELEREIGPPALDQPLADPRPELARRALRVGDHEERLDVEPVVDDGPHEALDEDRRLSGACSRGDEDAARRLDRRALLGVRRRAHARSLRQMRQRSHQCGQSPPCGS